MAITPTPADIGRIVILKRFNAEPLRGELVKVGGRDAFVRYPDSDYPIATDMAKLEWAD